MEPNRCSLCKGSLREGKTEFMTRVGDEIVVVKDVPAYVCEQCGEAYYSLEISRKLDIVMKDVHQGKLCARPLSAGEIELKV